MAYTRNTKKDFISKEPYRPITGKKCIPSFEDVEKLPAEKLAFYALEDIQWRKGVDGVYCMGMTHTDG